MSHSSVALLERPTSEAPPALPADGALLADEVEQFLREQAVRPPVQEVEALLDVETAATRRTQTFLGRMALEKTVVRPEGVEKQNRTLAEAIDLVLKVIKRPRKLLTPTLPVPLLKPVLKRVNKPKPTWSADRTAKRSNLD